jgi:hypothetical protein
VIVERLLGSLDQFFGCFLSCVGLDMLHDLPQNLLFKFLKVLGRQVQGCDKFAGEV